jgi:DNA invertase Pin-like site-specific DNA recombinase
MSIDSDLDIVELILKLAQAEGLSADAAHQIEQAVRADHGGERVRIPKRKKHMTPEQRQQAYADGLTNLPTEAVTDKHGISRRTLYRLLKTGPK